MNEEIPDDFIHAAFFFIDIVGLSNPILSTQTQRLKIQILNEKIYHCPSFVSFDQEKVFILPTGDGMLIGFKDGMLEPIKLAMELHQKLREYNESCPSTERIQVRIGCNLGYIFIVKDMKGKINLWGPGAILARRVMDLGDADHVFLTSELAEGIIELFPNYSKILHPLNDFRIKHGDDILLYSAYDDSFGNSKPPQKKSGTPYQESETTAKNAICDKITFNLTLVDEKHNALSHNRIYEISNYGMEPIYEFTIGLLTSSNESFEDMNIKLYEDGNDVKFRKINAPSPL